MLGFLLYWALQLFLFAMIIRFVADLIMSFNRSWRPNSLLMPVFDLAFTVTDPPLNFLRRFIKPIRFGGIGIDLAWTVLFFGVVLAQGFAARL